jgi:hypothetical protein
MSCCFRFWRFPVTIQVHCHQHHQHLHSQRHWQVTHVVMDELHERDKVELPCHWGGNCYKWTVYNVIYREENLLISFWTECIDHITRKLYCHVIITKSMYKRHNKHHQVVAWTCVS